MGQLIHMSPYTPENNYHNITVIGVASHWLKNWQETFKPVTTRNICNQVITFDSH